MANAVRCKNCQKTTRKKANVLGKRYRCKGCGSIDFEDLFEDIEIDFDDFDIIDEELQSPIDEDLIEEPVDVEEPIDDDDDTSSDSSSSDSSDCGCDD